MPEKDSKQMTSLQVVMAKLTTPEDPHVRHNDPRSRSTTAQFIDQFVDAIHVSGCKPTCRLFPVRRRDAS